MLPRMAPFQTININSGTLHQDNVYSKTCAHIGHSLILSSHVDLRTPEAGSLLT